MSQNTTPLSISFSRNRLMSLTGGLLALGLLLLLSLSVPQRIQAVEIPGNVGESTARQCGIEMMLKVYFEFQGTTGIRSETLLSDYEAAFGALWGTATRLQNQFCNISYQIDLETIEPTRTCEDYREAGHCITVVDEVLNRRGKLGDVTPSRLNTVQYGRGEWSVLITPVHAAYLFGQLLGVEPAFVETDSDNDGVRAWTSTRPQEADPWNLMARPWEPRESLFVHPDQTGTVLERGGLSCDPGCACGNGVVDRSLGEMCDPQATPHGCSLGMRCNDQCQCEKGAPICGNGIVEPGEACDYGASPSGCGEGLRCSNSCGCEPIPNTEETPPPTRTLPPAERAVCGDGICSPSETCISCYQDCKEVLNCSICGNRICEDNEILTCPSDCAGLLGE